MRHRHLEGEGVVGVGWGLWGGGATTIAALMLPPHPHQRRSLRYKWGRGFAMGRWWSQHQHLEDLGVGVLGCWWSRHRHLEGEGVVGVG